MRRRSGESYISSSMDKRTTNPPAQWRNWSRNQVGRPQSWEHPRDVEDVVQVVKRAETDGKTVKALGSAHSFTAVAMTDGVNVSLDRMSGVLSADTGTGCVTVHAGKLLKALETT